MRFSAINLCGKYALLNSEESGDHIEVLYSLIAVIKILHSSCERADIIQLKAY